MAFQFYLQSEKQGKIGWVRDDNHVVLVRNPQVKDGEMVHWHDATASSFVAKVQGKVFAHFHTVTIKVTIEFGIDDLA
jgi:hypothetical protein